MERKFAPRRRYRKTVEVDGTHHRVAATLLGGLGCFLFGPIGALVLGGIGYAVGRQASEEIAEEDLPEESADKLGKACIRDGDKEVIVTLEKNGTDTLTPFGRAIFGDKVSKTITYKSGN